MASLQKSKEAKGNHTNHTNQNKIIIKKFLIANSML